MNRTQKRKIHKTGAGALILGLILSTVSLFSLSFIGALILSFLDNPTASIGAVSFLILILSGSICGFFTSKYKGEGGVLPAMIASALFAVLLLIIGFIMSAGSLPLVVIVNFAVYFISATFFAILGKKREKKRRRK